MRQRPNPNNPGRGNPPDSPPGRSGNPPGRRVVGLGDGGVLGDGVDHNELARRIEQERRELEDAPVVKLITGPVLRCHFCGEVVPQLYEMETLGAQAEGAERGAQRMACDDCHPDARLEKWRMNGENI